MTAKITPAALQITSEARVVLCRHSETARERSPRPSSAFSTSRVQGLTTRLSDNAAPVTSTISSVSSSMLPLVVSVTTCARNEYASGTATTAGGIVSHARYRRPKSTVAIIDIVRLTAALRARRTIMRRTAIALSVLLWGAGASPVHASSYVFVRSSNSMTSNVGIERSVAIKRQYGSNFLWMRVDGRAYLIRDANTLDAIDALWGPVRALDPDYERVHARIRPLEEKERRIDHESDAISDDDNRSAADEARLRDLEREQRDVERELRVYEREEEELDRKEERLEREAERAMIPIVRDAIRKGIAKAE